MQTAARTAVRFSKTAEPIVRIDPKSHIPLFRQIADQLRERIERGVHRPGEALPSLRAFAIELRVNPNTIQRAYEMLEREGVVESRRGVGMFVAQPDSQISESTQARVADRLGRCVRYAFEKGFSAESLRSLFESTLRDHEEPNARQPEKTP